MKKTLLCLMLCAVATGASAHNRATMDREQVAQDMAQLETVVDDGVVVTLIDESTGLAEVAYVDHFKTVNTFITRHEAKERQLEKTGHKFIYQRAGLGLDTLEQKIAEYVEQEQPRYFSVDVFRSQHGQYGDFNYYARIFEYK